MKELRDGKYWFERLQEPLIQACQFMAGNRYAGVPDADERVADALAALVEGAHRFVPQPGKDSMGYFLDYVLSFVAGEMRNGASQAKEWSDEAIFFSDLSPDSLDIEYLFEDTMHEEAEDRLFALKDGRVFSHLELVQNIAAHPVWAARKLDTKPDDPRLPVLASQALDQVAVQLGDSFVWITPPPEGPEPVCHSEFSLPVIKNGVQIGTVSAAEVEAASRPGVFWTPEDLAEFEQRRETDAPWPTWIAADLTRSYRSPYMDDQEPDSHLTCFVNHKVVPAWEAWHADRLDHHIRPGAGPLLEMLLEGEEPRDEAEALVVETMTELAERLAEETDGVAMTVANFLAEELAGKGYVINKPSRLRWAFFALFGLDVGRWQPESQHPDSQRERVEDWVEAIEASTRRWQDPQTGEWHRPAVWKSQAAAVKALVLFGASPQEARLAARQAYAGGAHSY